MTFDAAIETVHSVCPHDCPSCCPLEVERLDGDRIGTIRGARDNSYNAGVICAKVARYAERVHNANRLTTPLRRVGDKGDAHGFEPMSWTDALDEVAEGLMKAAQRDGAEAVFPYYYGGTMGLVQRDGLQRLRYSMGYSRQINTICASLGNAGWKAGVGVNLGPDPREVADSDLIIIWGANPVYTQVQFMTHISRARKSCGAKLVVVDPYRNATAQQADYHLMVKPGTDGALACAVMHVLFAEGYADRDYLANYADCPEELEAHLQTRTPEWAAAITGLTAIEIVEFARLYGRTKRSYLRVGYGFSRSRNGAAQVHAVSCLPTVTGAWQHPGGGAYYTSSDAYGLDKTLIEGLDRLDTNTRFLDQSRLGPILTGDKHDLGDGPPVTALLVQNTNPAAVCPESVKVQQGLARDDLFVCVHEQFMTETAAFADIVLPATTFLEHDDLYISFGNTHMLVAKKVIEPLAESRSNHDVMRELAHRLGADHRGFDMTEWQIIDETLKTSGYAGADDLYEKKWLDCGKDFDATHFINGFGTPDGKFHFAPDWAAHGHDSARMPRLPDQFSIIDDADDAHPFRLVTAPARQFLNTSFTETPTSQIKERRPEILLHCDDLAALDAATGDRIRIGNRNASIVIHARAFDGVQRGVAVVESVWPNAAFEEGLGINALTSADAGPPFGGAVFHDTAVWVRKAEAVAASPHERSAETDGVRRHERHMDAAAAR